MRLWTRVIHRVAVVKKHIRLWTWVIQEVVIQGCVVHKVVEMGVIYIYNVYIVQRLIMRVMLGPTCMSSNPFFLALFKQFNCLNDALWRNNADIYTATNIRNCARVCDVSSQSRVGHAGSFGSCLMSQHTHTHMRQSLVRPSTTILP
jgi:hypothetical protein